MNITNPRTFLLFLVGTTASILLLIVVAAIFVDPYAFFGSPFLPPLTTNPRREKIKFLKNLHQDPQALVLGSSRAFTLRPAQIEAVTGCPTFNLSVNNARPEEYLSLLRFAVEEARVQPTLLLVALDLEAFDDWPAQMDTTQNPLFRTYLHLSWPQLLFQDLQAITKSLTLQYLRDMIRSVTYHFTAYPPSRVTFALDGEFHETQTYPPPVEWVESDYAGSTDVYAAFRGMNTRRRALMDEFLRYTQERNIRVVFYLSPISPPLAERAYRLAAFTHMKNEMTTYFEAAATQPNVSFIDFTDIESFGGDPENFADPIHMLDENGRRLLTALLPAAHLEDFCRN